MHGYIKENTSRNIPASSRFDTLGEAFEKARGLLSAAKCIAIGFGTAADWWSSHPVGSVLLSQFPHNALEGIERMAANYFEASSDGKVPYYELYMIRQTYVLPTRIEKGTTLYIIQGL